MEEAGRPDGIAPDRVETLVALPVDALWGVGPVTAKRLRERGIATIPDVRAASDALLREAVGTGAEWLRDPAEARARRGA